MDWASSIRHVQDVRLLILGSIMDKDFSSQFLMQLDKLQTTTSLATQWLQKKFRKRAVVSSIKGQPSSDYDVETWINDSNGNVVQHFPALTKEHFLGLLSDGVFYALINTSLSEGMSSAILEAMSIGVVVLARDIPSNKSIITDGYNGFLFRNGGGFVNQAKNLLNNDPLRQKIISNARTYARLHHSPCEEAKFYVSLAQSTFL
uniref:Glycosyltransferase 1 domain-containing protein 1-like n=1 Tax=Phallusia mammillata TaxID=59560 RepID=A0A6F9DEF9_9ASCI|nr:glycosyltransferase 1 domain-containing protein 1-like [Phallusia mammillata]